MSPLKNGKETKRKTGDKMKKENLKYVWLAIFVTMVCTIVTCQMETDSSMDIKKEVKEEVKEEAVEPIEVEKPVEVEEPIEEVEVEEAPIEFIPPVDTLERKEFYDENDWKYDETVPAGGEDGKD